MNKRLKLITIFLTAVFSFSFLSLGFPAQSHASSLPTVQPEWYAGSNDSEKLQNAINSLPSGGTVQLTSGKTYTLTSTVYYKSHIKILGQNSTIDFAQVNIAFDKADSSVHDVTFEGITFTHNDLVPDDYSSRSGTKNQVVALKGYFPTETEGILIKDSTFKDIAGRAVFLKGVNNLTLEKNDFLNVYDAVEFGSSGTDLDYAKHEVKNTNITGNYFYNVSTGIIAQGLSDTRLGQYKPSGKVKDTTISGNTFSRVSSVGIEFYGYTNGGLISNNKFYRSPRGGIHVKLSKNITIQDNLAPYIIIQGNNSDPGDYDFLLENIKITRNSVISDYTQNPQIRGIMIWRQARNIEISSNTITNAYYGLSLGMTNTEKQAYPTEKQENITVRNNAIYENDLYGTIIYNTEKLNFFSNHIYNNGHTYDNQGIGIRIESPILNSSVADNLIEDLNKRSARRQAVGMYFTSSSSSPTTEFIDNQIKNHKSSNIFRENERKTFWSWW